MPKPTPTAKTRRVPLAIVAIVFSTAVSAASLGVLIASPRDAHSATTPAPQANPAAQRREIIRVLKSIDSRLGQIQAALASAIKPATPKKS